MIPGLLEYVTLRLARRFLASERMLLRFGHLIPYYRTNSNQVDPDAVVAGYGLQAARLGWRAREGAVVVEVGSGATNGVAHALARSEWAGAAGRMIMFEPFVPLDEDLDARVRGCPSGRAVRVERVTTLDAVANGEVDLVLSNSVLEHVRALDRLVTDLDRVLSPTGLMIHAVDYRDHFFKYPYHFLTFSDRTWERWLDPGDLPRWRLPDHLKAFRDRGFVVEVLEETTLHAQFAAVRERIDRRFDRDDPRVAAATAVLAVRRPAPAP